MKISGWSLIRLFTLFVYITMFAPIAVVIILSFNPMEFASFPMEGFSFRWYVRLAHNQSIITAFKTSLILGFITSVISTAIAIPAAMAFVRYDFPGKNTLNTLLLTPIMIPEVILGVALLLFLRWLQQPKSFALLLIGHVVLTLPYVLLIVQARLVGIRKEYEEAAKSLGANAFQTFREVTFPLLLPAILAGRDLLAQAKTGSGKTAAFAIGLLHRIAARTYRTQALVLCPTRELAAQVAENFEIYGKYHKLTMALLIGGVAAKRVSDNVGVVGERFSLYAAGPNTIAKYFGADADRVRRGRSTAASAVPPGSAPRAQAGVRQPGAHDPLRSPDAGQRRANPRSRDGPRGCAGTGCRGWRRWSSGDRRCSEWARTCVVRRRLVRIRPVR